VTHRRTASEEELTDSLLTAGFAVERVDRVDGDQWVVARRA
jgi:hypothetical protein